MKRRAIFIFLSIIIALSPIIVSSREQNYFYASKKGNPIEGATFYDFHIHQATEKYQEIGAREDTFAKPTDRFADFQQAIACMFKDCGFEVPLDSQGRLFEEI